MSSGNNKWHEIYRQLALWLMVAAAAYAVTYSIDHALHGIKAGVWMTEGIPKLLIMVSPAPFIAMLYYYWLHRQYIARKKYAGYALSLIPFIIIMMGVNILSFLPGYLGHFHEPYAHRWILGTAIQTIILIYCPFIIFYTAARNVTEMKRRRLMLQREGERLSILLLNNQLEPHFLFNTLNAIYATAQKEGANTTLRGIEELAAIARYVIETSNKERVAVEEELKFTEQYLFLQRMCMAADTYMKLEQIINWDRQQASIAPMMLLPFAAYAFSMAEKNGRGSITIDVVKRMLSITAKSAGNEARAYDGLQQARMRLDLEYDNKYCWEEQNVNDQMLLQLSIDLSDSNSITS